MLPGAGLALERRWPRLWEEARAPGAPAQGKQTGLVQPSRSWGWNLLFLYDRPGLSCSASLEQVCSGRAWLFCLYPIFELVGGGGTSPRWICHCEALGCVVRIRAWPCAGCDPVLVSWTLPDLILIVIHLEQLPRRPSSTFKALPLPEVSAGTAVLPSPGVPRWLNPT